MDKTLGLSIVLGAALSAGFQATVGKSVSQLNQVGQAVKAIEQKQGNIDRFQALARDVRSLKNEWETAQAEVKGLAREIEATIRPTKKQAAEFDRAKTAASHLKRQLGDKRAELRQVKTTMQGVGQATTGLRAQQIQLGQSADMLRGKYNQLDRAMKDRSGIDARRAAMRGQALDALAMGAAVVRTIQAPIAFEEAMADVRKVVDFETPEQFKQMGKDILKLSTTDIPMATTGLAQIVGAAGRAGLARQELLPFASDAAKVGVAWEIAAEQAGSGMTGLRTIFKLNQEEAMGLADAFNFLDNGMDAYARDILQVVNRTGATGKLMGLSGQQVAALGSTFLALKTPPQVAATSMNAFFNRMATADRQSEKFKNALEEIGWTAEDMKDAVRDDAQGALLEFLETVSNAEDVQGTLSDMFGMEYADDLAKLVGGLDTYKHALGLVSDETRYLGAVQREFDVRSSTTANNWMLFKNRANAVAVSLGGTLLPAVNSVLGGVGSLMSGLVAVADAGGPVTTIVLGTAVGLMGLKIAALGAGYAWTFVAGGLATARAMWAGAQLAILWTRLQLLGFNATAIVTAARMRLMSASGLISGFMSLAGTAIPAVIGGIRAMGIAMMANPVGLIVGGIALAAGLVIANWDKVKTFFGGLWSGIKAGWNAFMGWLGKAIEYSPLGLLMKGVDFVSGLFGSGKPKAGDALSGQQKPGDALAGRTAATVLSNTTKADASNVAMARPVVRTQAAANDRTSESIPEYKVATQGALAAAGGGDAQAGRQVNMGGVTIHVTQQPGEDGDAFARRAVDEMNKQADTALHDVE